MWVHPIYTREQIEAIDVAHREAKTFRDRFALTAIRMIRSTFDFATGYKHPPPGHEADKKFEMTPELWLRRFLFLESIAGVPGMVGGMVRHLQSLRILRRDNAWIETLLEEAYNERMHLLTFMQLTKPGWFMRLMLLGGQGVFFNLFFVSYLISPRTCHRFVGYLEEEAIITYTRCLKDIAAGRIPEWKTEGVPQIAKKYWRLDDNATMEDLIYYVRADEAKHREVNHTLANLKPSDPNPFVIHTVHNDNQPSKSLKTYNPIGWERKDVIGSDN
ncbi:hypothetical protein CANCADRAFT_23633 [Tortispora caseinolytica NRRL Y-17796]|uniref:Alternative oxidase n=1 Tax=Tortispora caseinolytica NRRL Y-17796 TaxID=767744 RepID=A0A1E4TIA6_9ASCO|nr:hypothetical protein CANCADRAFT_23633 [Tortispora caseinolytica NRRL Y-17796]